MELHRKILLVMLMSALAVNSVPASPEPSGALLEQYLSRNYVIYTDLGQDQRAKPSSE